MRNTEDMIKELQEKVGAITRQEQRDHRAAGDEFDEARKLLEAARGYNRQMLYFDDDENMRQDLAPAYRALIHALEKAADVHVERGDAIVYRMSLRNKNVSVNLIEAPDKE